MAVFGDYSRFYDALYSSKDYPQEAAFIQKVIKKYSPYPVKHLLSLGCGTCSHDLLLARKGYDITGLDRSKSMLNQAAQKIKKANLGKSIHLRQADIHSFNLKKEFDTAIAMFNVVGYQIANHDITGMFQSTAKHLKKAGLFLFDCWYAPAVIADPPTDRVREVKQGKNQLIRLTQSTLIHQKNLLQINFHVLSLTNKKLTGESNELHQMRYWSLPEIDHLLEVSGFKLLKACPFLNLNSDINSSQWDIFIVAQKK